MDRIRELREQKGWTQTQLGKRLDLAKTTISGYESGDRLPDLNKLCSLCDVLGCTSDYLLERSDTQLQTIPDDAVRLWNAYKAAEPNIQASIRLQLNLVNAESKIDTAAS